MIKNLHGIFIASGLLCILFSVSLTGYNVYQDIQAGKKSESIIRKLRAECLDGTDVSYYEHDRDYTMPTIEIDGVKYIGILSISELGLELPVASEWSYPQLKNTPCRYSGSAYSNDMVVCAHNYRTHFGMLSELPAGAQLSFTDVDGNVFHYEVYDVEILNPNQAKEMKEYDDGLTLFTCTLGGRTRMTVRTVLIEDLSAEK